MTTALYSSAHSRARSPPPISSHPCTAFIPRGCLGRGGRVRNSELGRTGAVRPLWSEADNLRERIAEADSLYGFFSFDTALSQRASHGHLRTNPAARAALIRLCAATTPSGRGERPRLLWPYGEVGDTAAHPLRKSAEPRLGGAVRLRKSIEPRLRGANGTRRTQSQCARLIHKVCSR